MSDIHPPSEAPILPTATAEPSDYKVMALHAETVSVAKQVRKTLVRAARTTRVRDVVVEEDLSHAQIVVERVPVGRVVETVPPVRQEGDITILSVVEEEIVVTRRLVLKEEVHLRRVTRTEKHAETLTLREQVVAVTRTALDD